MVKQFNIEVPNLIYILIGPGEDLITKKFYSFWRKGSSHQEGWYSNKTNQWEAILLHYVQIIENYDSEKKNELLPFKDNYSHLIQHCS